jgi:hypothetical protein
MDLMVLADATVSISIGLFERLGAFVVDSDIASNFAGEVSFGREDATGDQVSLNFGEPDFELIEPRRVSRGVRELNVGMGSEELTLAGCIDPTDRFEGMTLTPLHTSKQLRFPDATRAGNRQPRFCSPEPDLVDPYPPH